MDPSTPATIADYTLSCLTRFHELLLGLLERQYTVLWTQYRDELGRFNLWSSNTGALARVVEDSLDYRLKHIPDIQELLLGNLDIIWRRLSEAHQLIIQECGDLTKAQGAKSIQAMSLSIDGRLQSPRKALNPLSTERRLQPTQRVLKAVHDKITWLLRLSNSIKKASCPTLHPSPPEENGEEAKLKRAEVEGQRRFYEHALLCNFTALKKNVDAKASEWFKSRILDTMMARRNRILSMRDRQKHRLQHFTNENFRELQKAPLIKVDDSNSNAPPDTPVKDLGTTLNPKSVVSALNVSKLRENVARSRISVVSTFIGSTSTELPIPPAPIVTDTPDFECPYCCLILPAETAAKAREWHKHVKHDAEPYFCLFDPCETSDVLYLTSKGWLQHMESVHLTRWICPLCQHKPPKVFFEASSLTSHLRSAHNDRLKPSQEKLVVENSTITASTMFEQCPFCGMDAGPNNFENHVARHMLHLAFVSMPLPETLFEGDRNPEVVSISDADERMGSAVSRSTLNMSEVSKLDEMMDVEEEFVSQDITDSAPPDASPEEYWEAVWPGLDKERTDAIPSEAEISADPVLCNFLKRAREAERMRNVRSRKRVASYVRTRQIPLSQSQFTVAIICILSYEAEAISAIFDEFYDDHDTEELISRIGQNSSFKQEWLKRATVTCDICYRDEELCILLPHESRCSRCKELDTECTHDRELPKNIINDDEIIETYKDFSGKDLTLCGSRQIGNPEPSVSVRSESTRNEYRLGRIADTDVILAILPGLGQADMLENTIDLKYKFPDIRLALLVGMCGGVPNPRDREPISLGDVIISNDIVQLDLGHLPPKKTRFLSSYYSNSTVELQTFIIKLGESPTIRKLQSEISDTVREILSQDGFEEFQRPLEDSTPEAPHIHLGRIASTDAVIKSPAQRDQIANAHNVISFEMQGGGISAMFPSIVIKSVCDFADGDMQKQWRRYACAVAAATAKAVLKEWRDKDEDSISTHGSGGTYESTNIFGSNAPPFGGVHYSGHIYGDTHISANARVQLGSIFNTSNQWRHNNFYAKD